MRHVLAGETDWSIVTPHAWKAENPKHVRVYRSEERRTAADRKRTHGARKRALTTD